MLEGPSSRLFDKTSPRTPQMAIFDSSILAAGRLDQRKETKRSRQPAASQLCDAIADPACGGACDGGERAGLKNGGDTKVEADRVEKRARRYRRDRRPFLYVCRNWCSNVSVCGRNEKGGARCTVPVAGILTTHDNSHTHVTHVHVHVHVSPRDISWLWSHEKRGSQNLKSLILIPSRRPDAV